MTWTDIALAPLGVTYFGDGRPMAAGETDFGEGRFPLSPSTAQGIVRSALLRSVADLDLGPGDDQTRIAALVGPPEALPDGWQLAGPWLARWRAEDNGIVDAEPWLALPNYLVWSGKKDMLTAVRPLPLDSARMRWDVAEVTSAPLADHRSDRGPAYVGPAGLAALLGGAVPTRDHVSRGLPDFVKLEPRVGLQIEPGREVAAEGMLYTLGYQRFADDAGMVVRFRGSLKEGLDAGALTRGTTYIGGRTRLARLLEVRSWSSHFETALAHRHLPATPDDGARFWLWTTTPVALDRPWSPQLETASLGGAALTIETALIGRSEAIGGFALAADRSRSSARHMPAGSSWLVAVRGGSADERARLLRSLHDAFPFASDPAQRAMGFGHTLLSRMPD